MQAQSRQTTGNPARFASHGDESASNQYGKPTC